MPLQAQTKETAHKDSIPFLQGMWVEFDVAPFLASALINQNTYTTQGNIQLNLKNKYFPVFELGIAGADKTTADDIRFKTNGMFGKIGLDIPAIKPKPNSTQKSNNLLVGFRLGMSHFNYSILNQTITDAYWGNSETFNLESIPATKLWFEITAGIRVEVYKNLYMGWNIRNKHLITQAATGENTPWYIPGYGKANTAVRGFSYTFGYRLK